MKTKINKVLSFFLALLMMVSIVPFTTIEAEAATSFTPRFSAPAKSGWYANYDRNNCVMYARCRANEICGKAVNLGTFPYWYSNAQKNRTFAVGQQPKLGAVACWAGHVAVVEAIQGNKITFSEGHYFTNIQSEVSSQGWTGYSNIVVNGGGGSSGTWFDNFTTTYNTSTGRPNCRSDAFYGYVYLIDSTGSVGGSGSGSASGKDINTNTSYNTEYDKTAKKSVGTYKNNNINDCMNIRNGAGKNYTKIGSMPAGTSVYVSETNGNWGKCTYNGVTGWVCLDYFTFIQVSAPGTPTVKVEETDIAQGSNAIIKWDAVSNATGYKIKIESNTYNDTITLGNKCSYNITLDVAQKYSFSVVAYGEGGDGSYSSKVSCTAHAPSTVTFVDWDDEVIESVEVKYGEDAKAPEIPSREGHTFSSWDSSYYNITSDKTIKATYKINTYTVNFIGADDEILKTEKVQYGESATPPTDTKAPSGYVFQAWENNSFRNVYVENGTTLNVHAVYYWENPDIPIICSNATATRQDDGYYVYFDLKNYDLDVTRGRAVVSLKTADDKLVDMSESAAFSLPKSGTKTDMEVFIPCDKAATSVEIVIVDSYSSGVPISEKVTVPISNDEMWSDWSDTEPENADGTLDVEERTVYRSSKKETTTGNTKTKEGYIYDGVASTTTSSGSSWNVLTAINTDSQVRKITTVTEVYGYNQKIQYHYHRYKAPSVYRYGPFEQTWSGYYCNVYQATGWLDYSLSVFGTGTGYGQTFKKHNSSSDPWYNEQTRYVDNYDSPIYKTKYYYTDTFYTYNFYKWGEFSEWSTTPVTATDDLKVETKTQYRYYSTAASVEDNTGEEKTYSGTLDSSFAGKQLTLFVYKVDGASDYTNEYIGQTEIGTDGSYSFTFKLREEPTVKTGDFTVAIGIEGTSDLIVIDTIEAPKAEYTVKFFNWDGDVISTQTVEEGENAALPENPVKEGYIFKGWDASITNIKQDLEIYPVFEKEVYSIIFVDWTKQSIVIEEYEHGDVITPPENSVIEGHDFSGWDMLNEGNVIATGDMVITAVYDKKVYNVNFYDFDGNIISTQRVAYNESPIIPDTPEADNVVFFGWSNSEDYQYVEHDVNVYPEYCFEETTDVPVANYETGEYSDAIELTLTSADENAVIYYYINGDEENTKQYTGPVTIDTTCSVSYYAQSLGKNDSEHDIRYYCINNAGEFTNWMLYSEIPEEVKNNLADYNLEAEDGYRFKDITTTTLVADVKNLEKTGWTASGNTTALYSAWQDAALTVDDTLIDCVVETQTVADTSVTNYQYSHYKYTDENGAVCYSPTEVDGYTCELETITLDSRLSIAGFLDDGTSYYTYNDEQWFTQKKVTGTKTQYRLAYSQVEYYKWTAWGIDAPSSSETREYENDTVYRYTNKNYHIVEVVGMNDCSEIYLVQSGKTLDTTEIEALTGYDFEGLYLDAEYTESWDYTDAVTESVVVYANYTPKQYTVTFQMQDGTELDSQTVSYMESAVAPETDSVPGWVFAGWDKDFSFVTEDMVVTGKYIKESEYARISLNTSKAMMYAGNRITLIPAITPADLSDERIEWSSSDPTIAAVDDNGIVTAVSAGEAVITVTVVSTKETATCNVTVTADSSTTILLNDDAVIGFDTERNLRITPSNAHTVADLKEQFQNEELVFIDSDGNELADDALVGTGTTIKLLYNGEELDAVDVVLTGDFNCDGSINNKDVVMINQYVLEKRTANNDQMIAIDVNGDGSVNNRDCAMLAQYLVDKITL